MHSKHIKQQRWLKALGIVLGLVGIVALSACATKPAPKPVVSAPANVAPDPKPVVVQPEAQPVEQKPPAPIMQMRVAVLVPLTGPNARVGQAIANAAAMALLDIDSQTLKLTTYNTEMGAALAAEQAISQGAHVILGPLFGAEAKVVQPIAKSANVPVITFSNDATLAQPGTFVLGFQPTQEINRVVDFARRRGVVRFAALVPSGQYGSLASASFSANVRASGGQVSALEVYPRDRNKLFASARRITNYEGRLAQARTAAQAQNANTQGVPQLAAPPFDALMIADGGTFARAFAPVLRQFGAVQPKIRLLGTGLWATEPQIVQEPLLSGAWFAAVPEAQFEAFAQRYTKRYGAEPARLASLGYDSILLIAGISQSWKAGQPFPANALLSPGGFSGVDGIFRFRGNIAERGLEVVEVTPAGFKTVSPAPRSFASALTN
jgi:branched-chain amino acid transport system substrate-binding protein